MRYEDTRSSNAMHKYEGRVTTLLRIIALWLDVVSRTISFSQSCATPKFVYDIDCYS